MMNFYKYEKLYELFISNNIVTTAILLENGYSKYDIGTLVKNNVLNRTTRGIYSLDLSDKDLCLEMFSKRLDVDNLDGVLECYEALESKHSEEVDCASLLIILAYLYDLPKEYKERAMNTEVSTFDNGYPMNLRFRSSIYSYSFGDALFFVNSSLPIGYEKDVFTKLLKIAKVKFWRQARQEEGLVDWKKYDELLELYQKLSSERRLGWKERIAWSLVQDIMSDDALVEKAGPCKNKSLEDLVQLRRYRIALEVSRKDDFLCKLLREAVKKKAMQEITYDEVVESFNCDSSTEIIRKAELYLGKIGCSNYARYISYLINLGDVENDSLHKMAAVDLAKISRGEFEFDVAEFIQDFYIALFNGELTQAAICFEIVSNSKNFNGPDIDVTEMSKQLQKARAKIQKEKKEAYRDSCIENYVNEAVLDITESKGLRVIHDLSQADKKRIRKKVYEKNPRILTESVGDSLVLRYKNPAGIYIDYYNFYEDASKAYLNGDYDAAIAALNTIVINSINVWDVTYHRLGLAYLARGASEEDFKMAYDCLWVAKEKGAKVKELPEVCEKTTYRGESLQYVKKQQ